MWNSHEIVLFRWELWTYNLMNISLEFLHFSLSYQRKSRFDLECEVLYENQCVIHVFSSYIVFCIVHSLVYWMFRLNLSSVNISFYPNYETDIFSSWPIHLSSQKVKFCSSVPTILVSIFSWELPICSFLIIIILQHKNMLMK